jgi:hypothetical protein
VLEWAASEGRVLLTHDVNTLTAFAYERIAADLPMPGVFEAPLSVPIKIVIEEILLQCQRRMGRESQLSAAQVNA